jgi:uncharacterized Zn-binding protein involved in type VI secretion
MPNAARIMDMTTHGGVEVGPGCATVLIGGMPAAVVGDLHICPICTNSPHPPSTFVTGSKTVLIGNIPALRVGDAAACGAVLINGCTTVIIG